MTEPLEDRRLLSAGDLDPTFGDDGKVLTDPVGGVFAAASAVAILPDGRVVVGGTSTDSSGVGRFLLARYNADGSLDGDFGISGLAAGSFEGFAQSMLVQPTDGKLLMAGSHSNNAIIARFNADGSPDPDFGGGDGWASSGFFSDPRLNALALQADGKIVAAGSAAVTGPQVDMLVVRYNADGTLDTSFGGGDGWVSFDFTDLFLYGDMARAIALQPDGKIVVAGDGVTQIYGRDLALLRLNADGTADASFGPDGSGKLTLPGSGTDFGQALALQSDGKVVIAGSRSLGAVNDFVLARYHPNGTLDAGFGVGGVAVHTFPGFSDTINDIVLQGDGKIVAAGRTDQGNVEGFLVGDFAVMRFQANGLPDSSFGQVAGITMTDFGGDETASAVALQADGRIVVAGWTQAVASTRFAVARYLGDAAVPGATTAGDDVVVAPIFQGAGESPAMELTFSSVTGPGVTTVTTSTTGEPPPDGFQILGEPLYYDINTSAEFTGVVQVTIRYDEPAASDEQNYRLMHYEVVGYDADGQAVFGWVDITDAGYPDTANNVIRGTASSLSPFAIFEAGSLQTVQIEVTPEAINVNGNGSIPLVIYTTTDFDATRVDAASIVFATAHATGSLLEDVDRDGDVDLVMLFRSEDTNLRTVYRDLVAGDLDEDGVLDSTRQTASVRLNGLTFEEVVIEGRDAVNLLLTGRALRDLLDELAAAGLVWAGS